MIYGVIHHCQNSLCPMSLVYLMVVFDTSPIYTSSPETARNGLFSGLFCYSGRLHQTAPFMKIGRLAVAAGP